MSSASDPYGRLERSRRSSAGIHDTVDTEEMGRPVGLTSVLALKTGEGDSLLGKERV